MQQQQVILTILGSAIVFGLDILRDILINQFANVLGSFVWLVIVAVLLFFVMKYFLTRRVVPPVVVKFTNSSPVTEFDTLPYRGLIAVASPISVQVASKRKNLLDELKETAGKDLIEKIFQTPEAKSLQALLEVVQRCNHLNYLWLISTESPNQAGTMIDTVEEAGILERAVRSLRPNSQVFWGKGKASVFNRSYHIQHNFEATLVTTAYEKIASIFDHELKDKGLESGDVLVEATTGIRQIGYSLIFSCLPRNRDCVVSIEYEYKDKENKNQRGTKPVLYKFDTVLKPNQ